MRKPIRVGVAFTNGWSWFNIATVLATLPGWAAHVAVLILFDDGTCDYYEVRFDADGLVGPLPLDKLTAWAKHPRHMLQIIWLQQLGPRAAQCAINFCEVHKHLIKGYAKAELASQLAARLNDWEMSDTPDVQTCSEFVARLLYTVSLARIDVRPKGRTFDFVSPNDVRNALRQKKDV